MTPTEQATASRKLRERADTFARDAATLRADGLTDDAPTYEVVARELRLAADMIDAGAVA